MQGVFLGVSVVGPHPEAFQLLAGLRFPLHIGLNAKLQYVVGGYCRWIRVMEPVIELALLHSGFATSFLLACFIL